MVSEKNYKNNFKNLNFKNKNNNLDMLNTESGKFINGELDLDMERLKKRVMRKVYLIWFVRSEYMLVAVLGGVFGVASAYISVADVYKNTLHSPSLFGAFGYLFSSFLTADILSKFLSVAVTAMTLFVGLDFLRRRKISGFLPFTRLF